VLAFERPVESARGKNETGKTLPAFLYSSKLLKLNWRRGWSSNALRATRIDTEVSRLVDNAVKEIALNQVREQQAKKERVFYKRLMGQERWIELLPSRR